MILCSSSFQFFNSNPPQRQEGRRQLPVNNFTDEVLRTIANNRCILIRGGTGCGKSTQVPQFILDHFIAQGNGADCNIVITQVWHL